MVLTAVGDYACRCTDGVLDALSKSDGNAEAHANICNYCDVIIARDARAVRPYKVNGISSYNRLFI